VIISIGGSSREAATNPSVIPPVTPLDALRERSCEANLQRATDALIAAVPVGRAVEITPDIIAAAAAGDVALLLSDGR